MDGTLIALFVIATFFGSMTTGLTGFAAGLVVSGVWLHIMSPVQSAVLIAAFGVVNQAHGIWRVRHALQWRRILPMVLGGAVGISQPVMFITMVLTTLTFAVSGHLFRAELIKLFLLGLPALLLGLWAGTSLYGGLDDAAFRKVILVLLLFAGISLVVPAFFR